MRLKQFVWITDIHFSLQTLQIATACLTQALEIARQGKIPLVISGDTNDTKAVLRSEVVRAITTTIEAYADVEVVVLVGNHDLDNERNQNSNCLYFLKNVKNVTLIESFVFEENEWGLIPYQNSAQKFRECVQYLKGKVKKLICHQGFLGAKMGNYAVDQTSISPLEVMDFDIVLTGHYHEHHRTGPKDHIIYGGSPYTISFAEAGQKKFIHIVTDMHGKIELSSVETNARRHISVDIHQETFHHTRALVQFRPEDLVRVQLFGEKAWISQFKKDFFAKMYGTENISIVPKPIKNQKQRMEIKNALQVGDVIRDYVASANTELDKSELMGFFAKEFA